MSVAVPEPQCPTCGAEASNFGRTSVSFKNGRRLYECQCGTGALLPSPVSSNDDFELYHDAGYMAGLSHQAHNGWLEAALRPLPDHVRDSLTDLRILDFGAGQGIWHDLLAERGCDVTSYEPNRALGEMGRQRGLRMYSDLNDLNCDNFDLIIANSVLEHVFSPYELVRDDIVALLAPGGHFLACVPNYEAGSRHLLRSRWMGWSPDEHIWFWSPRSARQFIERVEGLEPISTVVYAACGRDFDAWRPDNAFKRLYYGTAQRAFEGVGRGDQIVIVARCP